mmetsp:Transcript_37742/g.38411  ORF Transcript_37742/g.38411 Transcript_37742/m.38411 type:complete len:159 (+) Transcript_37742:141-617(+)
MSQENIKPTVAVIFCGDLNSTPETAVIEYLSSGVILPEHEVWRSLDMFKWEKQARDAAARGEIDEDDTVRCADLQDVLPVLTHDLSLYSAAGFPTYTNFHRDFQDILDYIYIQSQAGMEVERVAPFPPVEVLSEAVALPSPVFPSDHLSVVVDIKLLD